MGNIYFHKSLVSKQDRSKLNGHRSGVIWLTGLSGSGKSTIAFELEKSLTSRNINVFVLDGDNLRKGINKDLGFDVEDRKENNRRIAEVSKLFVDAGILVICSVISPFREERQMARNLFSSTEFMEVYIECPLEECIKRDPKGLYKKAILGQIIEFTGISSSYEAPETPELIVRTDHLTIEESKNTILNFLNERDFLVFKNK